jgi:hypothetical protein
MKFECRLDALRTEIRIVAGGSLEGTSDSLRTTTIVLRAQGTTAWIIDLAADATNGTDDQGGRPGRRATAVPASVEREGQAVLRAGPLYDALRTLEHPVVAVELVEREGVVSLSSGMLDLRVRLHEAELAPGDDPFGALQAAGPPAGVTAAQPVAATAVRARGRAAPLRLHKRFPRTLYRLDWPHFAFLSCLLVVSSLVPMPLQLREGLLIAALALATLLPAIYTWRRHRFDIAELGVFVGFAYLTLFPVRAIVVLSGLAPPVNARVDEAGSVVLQKTLIFSTLGLLAAGLGYIAPIGRILARRVGIPSVALAERPPLGVALGLLAVGAIAEIVQLVDYYSPTTVPLPARSGGLVSATTALLLVGLSLLAMRAVVAASRTAGWILGAAIVAVAAIGLAGAFKEIAILAILTPLLIWHFARAGAVRGVWWFVLAGVVVVFVVFPLVQTYRGASARLGTSDPTEVLPAVPTQYSHVSIVTGARRTLEPQDVLLEPVVAVSQRLYGFDAMTLVVRYTGHEVPYQHGWTLKNLAAGLVPRVLWPGKPRIGIGYWFARSYWGTPANIQEVPQTVTHPGELYIDFGIAGVVIGLCVLGLWYRFAWESIRPRESGTAAVVYTVLFVTVVGVDRDLPLVYVTLVQRLAVVAIMLLVLHYVPLLWKRNA